MKKKNIEQPWWCHSWLQRFKPPAPRNCFLGEDFNWTQKVQRTWILRCLRKNEKTCHPTQLEEENHRLKIAFKTGDMLVSGSVKKKHIIPLLFSSCLSRYIIIQPNASFICWHTGILQSLSKALMAKEGVLS